MRFPGILCILAACNPAPDPVDEAPVDEAPTDTSGWPVGTWNRALPDAASLPATRGLVTRRAVFHLHSPWSHDACDGKGFENGVLDTACRDDLRRALCTLRFDAAFLTDHPDNASPQPFEQLFHPAEADVMVRDGDALRASEIACDNGHLLRWRAGFEDALMPVGLTRHVSEDPTERHALLNRDDQGAQDAMRAAGARVLVAHPETRTVESLQVLQDEGLHGMEIFNLHAMFAPNLRPLLGLDAYGWLSEIGPFIAQEEGLEPDLFVLAVLAEQAPTIERVDALLQRGPLMLVAGSDAHQNVLSSELIDGERGDSYRRMLRWFSTMLLATNTSLDALDEAVAARRAFVAFEILGTPAGVDLHLEGTDGEVYEMGSDAPVGGTIVVGCPTLANGSPRGEAEPEITVTTTKNGAPWQTGCGRFEAGPGVYRTAITSKPLHLAPFLGVDASRWMRTFPWVYTGAVRVAVD